MMGPRTSSDRAIITAFSLAIVLVISLSAALITFAAHSINQEEMAREQTLASHAVATSLTEMAAQAETAASWDEAFANLGDSINQTWADRSLLAYYHTSFGHDLTLVFTPELKLGYVGRDGTRVNPIRYEGLAQSIKPTVAKAQAFELRRRRGLEKPGPAGLGDAVIDSLTVRDGDSIFQLGIATIEPTNGTAPGARPAALVVTGRRVDQRLLNGLHDSLGISGARFQTEPAPAGDAFIPVNDRNGRPLTFIVWPPLRPGLSAMAHEGGVSLAAGGLLALAMGALGWRIRKLLQDGREKDQALQSTLIDLEAARRRAEAASASKSAFLANMSHEIRTPLNGVLGMAQIMELGELAPHQRERVNVIVRSGKALLQILNDILDLSKIEAEMFELTYEDFRFLQVLENVELTFADIAAAKGIELKVIAGSDLDLILHGDPVRLRQILLNLVSNAVKFTPKGKVTLLAERNGGEILCHIIDDGAGISAEDLPLLFKKFSQLDEALNRQAGGTGLGLAICRDLATLMGGTIEVSSRLGAGSTFTLTLPLVEAKAPSASASDPECLPIDAVRSLRILAAEDNPTNCLILEAMLAPFGGDIVFASTGAEALGFWRTASFDLVLMDVQMPVMDGIEATRAIRASEAASGRARTPIIGLTANVMTQQVETYRAVGMDDVVAKPIDMPLLLAAIVRVIEEPAMAFAT